MFFTASQVASLEGQQWAFVRTTLQSHVLTIELARPEKKNALHPVMLRELAFALEHARENPAVRVVVLSAQGPIWCAGADLRAMAGGDDPQSTVPEPQRPILLGELVPGVCKPIIAKVHAPVMAGGILLLAGCTYVVAADSATFGLPEVKRGLFPFQVMAALLDRMPAQKVLDWCIRGRELGAQEALALGLATQLCAPDELDRAVEVLCEEIGAGSPQAIRLGLEAYAHLRRQRGAEEQQAYLMDMFFRCLQTEDAQEGMRAFATKRPPVWPS
jgi:enoyl-CoA hydratase/carnithine racemase